ncbi:MAG TPA: Gfo/Idh/MocA family oxidoreductase [bacterium]|nr:Gfo/Idh/MocA family oxidoreductase [bacterium]
MVSRPLRVGIVGVGNIAERHAQGYLEIPSLAVIRATADILPAVAQAKAEAWRAPLWFGSLDEMLASDIDAVDICLPHDLHVDAVCRVAQAGKHIYIEKPLARTGAECVEIIRAVEDAGVCLMVGHNLLFNPVVAQARALVEAGAVGQVFMVRGASYGWPPIRAGSYRLSRERCGGGVLADTGVHVLYMMRALAGEARAVSASLARAVRKEIEGEDNALLHLEYENGALGEMVASYSTKLSTWELGFPEGWDQRLEAYGDRGTLLVDVAHGALSLFSADDDRRLEPADWRTGTRRIHGASVFQLPNVYFDSFKFAVRGFVEAVLGDRHPPVTATDGYRVVQLVDAAYESARTGSRVTLKA